MKLSKTQRSGNTSRTSSPSSAQFPRRAVSALGAAALILLGIPSAQAASATWNLAPTDNNWVTSGAENNWSTGAATYPGSTTVLTNTDIATFNNASSITTININSATLDIGSVLFDTGATSYTIGASGANAGNSLLLSSGGAITLGSTATSFTGTGKTETINAPITLEPASATTLGAYSFTNNSTTASDVLNFAGNIIGGTTSFLNTTDVAPNEGGSIVLNLAGANTGLNTISSVISDGGAGGAVATGDGLAINKTGAGTWYLTGANTYTGETAVIGGTLNVASLGNYGTASAIGARTAAEETSGHGGIGLLIAGGTLQYTGSTTQTTNRQVRLGQSATSAIDSSGTAPIQFTFTGNTTNLFQVAGTRTLTLTGSNTGANLFSENLAPQGANATTLAKTGAGTWTYAGNNSGIDNLTISAGTLILSGNNTNTGTLLLNNGGTLQLQANSGNITAGSSSAIGVPSGGFQFSNGNGGSATLQLRSDSSVTFANTATGNSTGTTTLNYNVNNFGGADTTTGQTLSVGALSTYGTTINVSGGNGYTLNLAGVINGYANFDTINVNSANLIIGAIGSSSAVSAINLNATGGNLTATGKITNTGAITTSVGSGFTENISGLLTGTTLTDTGAGTLLLSGANNTYSGATTIGAGGGAAVIRATATQALSTGAINFDGTGNASTARLELANGISLNNAIALTGRTNNSVAIENISGNNTLSGTVTLGSGGSTYEIQSDAGLLTLSNATAITAASSTRTVTLQGAGNGLVSGAITNGAATAVGVTVAGTGTWTLGGTNTYTGATTVNSGTLNLTGSLANSAVTVNSGGTLTGAGNGTTTGDIGGSLAVNGGGAVTLAAANSATPLTDAGTLALGGTGAYGAGQYSTLNYTLGSSVEALNAAGALTLNSGGGFINLTGVPTLGTYNLLTYASQTGAGAFSLSSTSPTLTTETVGRNVYTLVDNPTSLQLQIAGNPTPGVAYFDGAVSHVWNDLSNPSLVNFSSNLAGTNDAGNIPGVATDVILNASTITSPITETLGATTTINSLNVNGNGTTTLGNTGDTTALTINALADGNMDTGGGYIGNTSGTAINIASGANPFTINVPLVLGSTGAAESYTNNSGSLFTINGTITGSAATSSTQTLTLANTGSGGTTVNSALTDPAGAGKLALTVNNTGSGVTTLTGANTYSGPTTVNTGAVQIGNGTTGSLTTTGFVTVGAASGNSVLTLNGASTGTTLAASNNPGQFGASFFVGNAAGAASDLVLNSGALTTAEQLAVGSGQGAYSAFTMNGGTANIGSYYVVGSNNDSSVFNQNAGALTVASNFLTIGAGNTASVGVANLSGGTFTSNSGGGYGGSGIQVGEFGNGTLNVSGTALASLSSNGVTLGLNTGAQGTVNLLGGTINTNKVAKGGGTGTFNFNGGTLQANAANAAFMTGLTNAYVQGGGATIDTQANAITIGQALLAPSGSGVSATGLTVSGGGFIDTPLVTVTGGDGTGATAVATIDGSGNLTGINITNPGTGYSAVAPTFTLVGGGIGNTGALEEPQRSLRSPAAD